MIKKKTKLRIVSISVGSLPSYQQFHSKFPALPCPTWAAHHHHRKTLADLLRENNILISQENLMMMIWCFTSLSTYLTLKAPIPTAADDIFLFILFYFSEKTSLDISCDLSAWQMIHMKCQDLFSLKNRKNKLECRLLQILLGTLRVKSYQDDGRVIMNGSLQWSAIQSWS